MLWPINGQSLSPFTEMRRLQGDLNRLFSGYYRGEESFPAVNVWSGSDEVLIKADIPGVDPKDINLTVKESFVTIEGEKKEEQVGENATFHRRERGSGKFVRSLQLPFAVDAEKVSAKCKDGVLTITLPRHESSRPHKIQIS